MAGKDIILMSQRDLKKLRVISKVMEDRIRQVEAANMLELSTRQIRRIERRIQKEGEKGILHRSRGKRSNRAYPEGLKEEVTRIYRDKYWDFGPLLASEKLFDIDKIKISDETLRKWLIESGDWKKNRKGREHRKWRERKHCFGEMLQGDGSHHDWFEGRGAECVLMAYIDDATGNVYARFYEYEGTIPAMDSFKKYIRKYGIPQSVYMDNHSTYKSQAKPTVEDDLNCRKPKSQFERAVEELGVEFIHANSPQAKGRIERLFRTFQDRVIKEMRLAGIGTIEDANMFLKTYLPRYNKRFRVVPANKTSVHREIPGSIDIKSILSIKTERVLRNDYTVYYKRRLYQILEKTRAKKVVIEQRISGKVVIMYKDKELAHKEIRIEQSKMYNKSDEMQVAVYL